jgi:hypothetical protein
MALSASSLSSSFESRLRCRGGAVSDKAILYHHRLAGRPSHLLDRTILVDPLAGRDGLLPTFVIEDRIAVSGFDAQRLLVRRIAFIQHYGR